MRRRGDQREAWTACTERDKQVGDFAFVEIGNDRCKNAWLPMRNFFMDPARLLFDEGREPHRHFDFVFPIATLACGGPRRFPFSLPLERH